MNGGRRRLLQLAAGGSALALLAHAGALPASPVGAPAIDDGRHDFDFYIGRWRIENKRLKQRFVGSRDWETFSATDECRPVLGGLGSTDDYRSAHYGDDFRGMTLRLFDPQTRRWSAYWASNRSGVLEPPVVGAFKGGVGHFEGSDIDAGQPVIVRNVWSEMDAPGPAATRALWEQAYSRDDGVSWETNWVMRMTRIGH